MAQEPTSIEDLRRQLKSGELYEAPAKAVPPEELWSYLAANPKLTKGDLDKLGISYAQIANQFGESVKNFGKAMEAVVDPVLEFGRSVGEVAKQVEVQMEAVAEAFKHVTEPIHPWTAEVGSKANRLVRHLEEKATLDQKARDQKLFEFSPSTDGGENGGCDECGAEPCFIFPSMTDYEWDGKGGEQNNPNHDLTLCSLCGFSHVEEMEDKWAEYRSDKL